jgi:hypothetical protein
MINIKQIIDDIYIVIGKKQSFFEFILNLSFVLIVFIILVILYWDNINRSIINNGRCKIAVNNSDVTYNLNIYDKTKNTNIIEISYDNTPEHNYKIDCACPVGNTINEFYVPVWSQTENKIENRRKVCYCDNNYKTDVSDNVNNNIIKNKIGLDGDGFLIDHYSGLLDAFETGKTQYTSIDFNNRS